MTDPRVVAAGSDVDQRIPERAFMSPEHAGEIVNRAKENAQHGWTGNDFDHTKRVAAEQDGYDALWTNYRDLYDERLRLLATLRERTKERDEALKALAEYDTMGAFERALDAIPDSGTPPGNPTPIPGAADDR